MNIKVDFDNIVVKEDKNDFNVKVLMLKGEKGDAGDGEPNVIEKVQVNGSDLPVNNKTVNVPVPTVDSSISSSSTNPVQNNTIYNALSNKVDNSALDNYYEISEIDGFLNNKADVSIVDKKPYYFDNVASMKAYNLKNGDYVITKGYYIAEDGGNGEYIIVNDTNLADDNGSVHTLANGLKAKLLVKDKVNILQFGAKGETGFDNTNIIQNAINFSNSNYMLIIPSATFEINSTLSIEAGKVNIVGEGYNSVIQLVNDTATYLLNIKQPSQFNIFKNIRFDGVNKIHTGIRISGNALGGGFSGQNWKNAFYDCYIEKFACGLLITTDRDPLDGTTHNFASENIFVHCKFKHNLTHIIHENTQSLNNLFLQTDLENHIDEDDGTHPMILNKAGGGLTFDTCSLMGKGILYYMSYPFGGSNLFSGHYVNFNNCRVEVFPNHAGSLFYQTNLVGTIYQSNFINVDKMVIYRQSVQDISLINYYGRIKAVFNSIDMYGLSDVLKITNNVIAGISNAQFNHLSDVKVTNSRCRIVYEKGSNSTGTNEYQSNIRYISNYDYDKTADTYGFKDLTGFVDYEVYPYQIGMLHEKTLAITQPAVTNIIASQKFILPAGLSLTKLCLFKQGTRRVLNSTINLYMVKNVSGWAGTEFNKETDAIKIATITDTLSKQGYFETNIQFTGDYGYDIRTGKISGYTEGRYYIEDAGHTTNKTSGIVAIKYY